MQIYINHDKAFAFVELKSIELTSACCQLDGILFKNAPVKIRRPNDFKPELIGQHIPTSMNLGVLGIVGTAVAEGPNKLFVGGLPYHLTDENVKELLSAFGILKSFNLVKEVGNNLSKGFAFCEYVDNNMTKIACDGLNNLEIGDKKLSVRIASNPNNPNSILSGIPNNVMNNTSSFWNQNKSPNNKSRFDFDENPINTTLDFHNLQNPNDDLNNPLPPYLDTSQIEGNFFGDFSDAQDLLYPLELHNKNK